MALTVHTARLRSLRTGYSGRKGWYLDLRAFHFLPLILPRRMVAPKHRVQPATGQRLHHLPLHLLHSLHPLPLLPLDRCYSTRLPLSL